MVPFLLALSLAVTPSDTSPLLEHVKDLVTGTGPAAVAGDVATVQFRVCLESGKEIADSKKRGLAYTFELGAEGNPLSPATIGMKKRGEREVVITLPGQGIPGIAPGSKPLRVWIELISLRRDAGPSSAP